MYLFMDVFWYALAVVRLITGKLSKCLTVSNHRGFAITHAHIFSSAILLCTMTEHIRLHNLSTFHHFQVDIIYTALEIECA